MLSAGVLRSWRDIETDPVAPWCHGYSNCEQRWRANQVDPVPRGHCAACRAYHTARLKGTQRYQDTRSTEWSDVPQSPFKEARNHGCARQGLPPFCNSKPEYWRKLITWFYIEFFQTSTFYMCLRVFLDECKCLTSYLGLRSYAPYSTI